MYASQASARSVVLMNVTDRAYVEEMSPHSPVIPVFEKPLATAAPATRHEHGGGVRTVILIDARVWYCRAKFPRHEIPTHSLASFEGQLTIAQQEHCKKGRVRIVI